MIAKFVKDSEDFVSGKIKLLDYCNSLIFHLQLSRLTLFKVESNALNIVVDHSSNNDMIKASKISLDCFPHFQKKIKEKKEVSYRNLLLKEKDDLFTNFNFKPKMVISLCKHIPYIYDIKSDKTINKSILFIFESALIQHFSSSSICSQSNKKYEDLRSEFIAKVSHEIRTPLNGIIGNTYLLKNQTKDSSSLNLMSSIEAAANELLKQLNSVLNFNAVKNGRIITDEKEIILNELIENSCKLFIDQAKSQNIHFTYEIKFKESLVFINDENKISQILISLLDNAFKFTKKGSVKVEVDLVKNNLQFTIKDSGLGITEDASKYVFDEFHQGDNSSTREHHGLGLGLSLCRQIVKSLNGEINFKSELSKGSSFYFYIPIIKKNEYENSQQNYKGSILLVEDYIMNQEITTRILNKMGFEVAIAENGAIGLEMATKNDYDLIFMDCQMPVMDGYTAAKMIKKIKPYQKILAFTAHAFEEDKIKCLESGMDDFLTKPINVPQFHYCIQKHVDHIVNNFSSGSLDQFLDSKLKLDQESQIFVEKLITDFNKSCLIELKQLSLELDKNNFESMRKICHKLKSTFASFGMNKTKNLLAEYQKQDKFTFADINILHNHLNFTVFMVHKWLNNKGVSNE